MATVTHYAPLYPLIVSRVGLIGIDPLEGSERLEGLRVDAICWQVERNNSCLYQCARFNLHVAAGRHAVTVADVLGRPDSSG